MKSTGSGELLTIEIKNSSLRDQCYQIWDAVYNTRYYIGVPIWVLVGLLPGIDPGKAAKKMPQVLGPLQPMGETRMKILAQAQLLETFWEGGSLCCSAFQMNK